MVMVYIYRYIVSSELGTATAAIRLIKSQINTKLLKRIQTKRGREERSARMIFRIKDKMHQIYIKDASTATQWVMYDYVAAAAVAIVCELYCNWKVHQTDGNAHFYTISSHINFIRALFFVKHVGFIVRAHRSLEHTNKQTDILKWILLFLSSVSFSFEFQRLVALMQFIRACGKRAHILNLKKKRSSNNNIPFEFVW